MIEQEVLLTVRALSSQLLFAFKILMLDVYSASKILNVYFITAFVTFLLLRRHHDQDSL